MATLNSIVSHVLDGQKNGQLVRIKTTKTQLGLLAQMSQSESGDI